MKQNPDLELSRPLRVEKISANGVEEKIRANAKECEALAQRFSLVEIGKLEAQFKITPERAGNFAVVGSFVADVVQNCVVTLEPLPAHIEQAVDVHYAPPELIEGSAIEHGLDEDDMEVIEEGVIDLGELVAQHFGLALDPYPRKAGLPPVTAEFGTPVVKASPFAKLVELNGKRDDP